MSHSPLLSLLDGQFQTSSATSKTVVAASIEQTIALFPSRSVALRSLRNSVRLLFVAAQRRVDVTTSTHQQPLQPVRSVEQITPFFTDSLSPRHKPIAVC